jgi:hypothetical protein
VEASTTSLEEVFRLPRDGQPHLSKTIPILYKLKGKDSVVSHCHEDGLKSRAIAVVKTVLASLSRSEDIYEDLWHGSEKFYASNGTTASRLLSARDEIVVEADANGARYRINALLFALHFRVLCNRLEREDLNPNKTETMVLDSLTEETESSRDQIHALLKRGRWYAQWIDRLGLGAIFLLGESFA